MSDTNPLKLQISQLSVKFIERTRGEVVTVCQLAQRVYDGDVSAFEQLNYLVHRIHGGGATFGFPELGACAGSIEHMIEPAVRKGEKLDAAVLENLMASCKRLDDEVRKASGDTA